MNIKNFYVSPLGNDSFSGHSPDCSGQDGPFKTIAKAVSVIEAAKEELREGEINIFLRGGTYEIDKTIVFSLKESGSDKIKITLCNFESENPVITAAKKIDGFKPMQNKELFGMLSETAKSRIYEADIPAGFPRFQSLFENGKGLTLGRSSGFTSRVKAFCGEGEEDLRSKTLMYCDDKAPLDNIKNPDEIFLFIRPWCLWTVNILPVKIIDSENRIIETEIEGTYPLTRERYERFGEKSAWLENVTEGLEVPGSFIVCYNERKVYINPFNEEIGIISAPLLNELIKIEGRDSVELNSEEPVQNVHIRGISFTGGERSILKKEDIGVQHDWEFMDKANGAVRLKCAKNCSVSHCKIFNSGGSGIRLDLYCQNITVSGCYIHEIGGTGISLIGYGAGHKNVNFGNTIHNNKIDGAAMQWFHNSGILVTQSGKNIISNNEICRMPYNGMSITGVRPNFVKKECMELVKRYNFAPTGSREKICNDNEGVNSLREIYRSINYRKTGHPEKFRQLLPYLYSRENIITKNRIHNVMQVLGDGNGIYISDTGVFNVIRNNFIYDLNSAHGAAIRTDAFQLYTLIEKNIVYNCSEGIFVSRNNMLINNFVVNLKSGSGNPCQTRECSFVAYATDEGPLVASRNIFYNENGVPLKYQFFGILDINSLFHDVGKREITDRTVLPDMDFNIYYSKSGGKEEFLKLKENNIEQNSLWEDPGFKNVSDFSLLENSAAKSLGIEAIDVEETGLTKDFNF